MTRASQITYFHLVATAQRQTQKSRLHYSQFTSSCVPFFCRFLKLRFYVAELSAEMPGIRRLYSISLSVNILLIHVACWQLWTPQT